MWTFFKLGLKAALGLGFIGAGTVVWIYCYGRASGTSPKKKGEAIVVMGARVLPRGQPSKALRARAERAAQLFHEGTAPWVLISGGRVDMPKSEAQAGCEVLVQNQVPSQACLREEQSRSTAQNAEFSAPLLKQHNIGHIVLVSDGYHLLRACAYFRRQGFSVTPVASARTLPLRDEIYWTAREAVALLARPWVLWWTFER
ncbi:MAG: YdcF family protein [Cystobacterineae bacterium]|nr:YdcF family protein [Cystobacterineae bacterium]